jgi:hypothetical protein
MPGARIDRLTIDAGAMGPADARELILRVAAGLADAQLSPASVPVLRVSGDGSLPVDQLADRIVADVLRQLRRTP